MKKITITILTILVLTLTACGGASDSPQADSDLLTDSYENALPIPTQLLIGTFQLETTDLAVTPEQAAELIPLWQVLQSLNESDSAAQEETDALIKQIQETMNPEQIQSIKEMQLTPEDMFAVLQENGIVGEDEPTFLSGEGEIPFPPQGGGGDIIFIGPGGGPPGGGGPGGGQSLGLSPEQIATAQASGVERRVNVVPPMLISALIEFLQEKAGS
jgi:hypothetical protein